LSQLLLLDDRRADGVAGARALRYRIEAQFWKNEELLYGRRFDPALDATRTSRELAVLWATEERKAIEASSDFD